MKNNEEIEAKNGGCYILAFKGVNETWTKVSQQGESESRDR